MCPTRTCARARSQDKRKTYPATLRVSWNRRYRRPDWRLIVPLSWRSASPRDLLIRQERNLAEKRVARIQQRLIFRGEKVADILIPNHHAIFTRKLNRIIRAVDGNRIHASFPDGAFDGGQDLSIAVEK